MTAPLLEADSVTSGYGTRPVVRGVSFALGAGESLAVVGPNAAGKSTLLRALAGASRLLGGRVNLSGVSLADIPARDRARRLALVPQSARWDLDFTVREMVALGRAPYTDGWGLERPGDQRAIDEALSAVDLVDVARRFYSELSGGERQRVLIARALAQAAAVLLFDEPTAHLDLGHQLLVMDHVHAHVAGGGAAVVVLHDLAMAARLQRVAVLDGGLLVALGAPLEVLTPERLRRTWGIDAELVPHAAGPSLVLRGRAR
jgi:iron complex transport system ATP-binding protein